MPGNYSKHPRTCPCGYTTQLYNQWSIHRRVCEHNEAFAQASAVRAERAAKDDEITELRRQLVAKDAQIGQLAGQLADKDRLLVKKDEMLEKLNHQLVEQAREGSKRPRIVLNNNTVNVNIVAFGKDWNAKHITDTQTQRLLTDPGSSVPKWLALAWRDPANRNVRIPNVRAPTVQVFMESGEGDCKWQPRPKQVVLSEIVESVAMCLEAHAAEDKVGERFSAWYERLLDDCEADGRMFKEQKELAFQTIAVAERDEAA